MAEKRRRGDRKDGVLLRDVDSYHKIMPFLMPRRTECEVFFCESIDMTNLLAYIEQKKSEGCGITLFSAFVATAVRTAAVRPALNRFICGQRMYERKTVDVGFIAKKYFGDEAEEAAITIPFENKADIFEVTDRIYSQVHGVKEGGSVGSDDVVGKVAKLPRFLKRFVARFLRLLNYYGKVPESISSSDPNFCSIFISNMGSIQAGAPFHHLNEWGTNSVFLCIGKMYDKLCMEGGNVVSRPYVDFAFTVDERISDGYYFARTLDVFKEIILDPEVLEKPLSEEGVPA
ncbi:MAG: 2-oxo acid dehydrogenase subunit E2 [Candidatus Methanomethylophilaceae archaeon]|nr:2-oxo acid dehydrogenase subunit E2 [Candidatus Methanomethylophilaceae archaeon]MDD2936070.1 2-oxo acid dehydrogenase subunit E2 [Candidatus Methanomethylophilaceae archaeon]MDD3351875.1 2-oxo acid dehydrogenase subunit E2 [Candidatus Methanomethylophilaceae archaeon]MDD3986270.1 2-oxo acid dehydrogenase subunit E2 [Candidatus Methanomethylophilaceae archaeon]NCA74204.1 hypothetical protein [Gammaproteobacteria bacterium]